MMGMELSNIFLGGIYFSIWGYSHSFLLLNQFYMLS